jgi:1-acyl-sn-glycerol-3-phosphate acyltransferase
VGRIIQGSRATVVPVFVNGLGNDLFRQVRGNFDRRGEKVAIVFGKPIDFGNLLEQESGLRTHRAISEKCMEAIAELGQEEKSLRACGGLSS